MTARQRGWLLPPMALFMLGGVLLGKTLSSPVLPAVGVVLALLAFLLMKGRLRFLSCLILTFCIGAVSASVFFHPVLPDEGDYNVTGIVSDEITSGSFGQRRCSLSSVTLDGRPYDSGAYWTFYTDDFPAGLEPGKQVSFHASLYHPRGRDNPDDYDFRESLLCRGLTVGLYGDEALQVRDPYSFTFIGFTASLRHRLTLSLIDVLGEESGAYAAAMLLGNRIFLPSEDREAFSRLGIAHLLSVSGFHVGLLIGIFGLLFRCLHLRQRVRLVLYALLLTFYSLLCGLNLPVIRASLFFLLALEGKILNRPRSALHILSATFLLTLLFSPVQVTTASFQLTYGSVFGIFWFLPFLRRLRPPRNRLLRRVRESLAVTFGAQAGAFFPQLWFFQRLPLLAFVVNLPAAAIASVLIIVYWLVLFLLPFPGAASAVSGVARSVTGLLLQGIRSLSSLPGITLWVPAPVWLTALGILLVLFACCAFIRLSWKWRTPALLAGLALVVVSLLPLPHTGTEYIQFSVGNADAAVLRDRDQVIVFDTGNADGVLSGWLRRRKLTPDAVVLTHLHTDHAGGLQSLLDDEIPVPLILLPVGAEEQAVHEDVLSLLRNIRASGTEIRTLSRGDVLPLPSGGITVLWPEDGRTRPGQDANNYSLVTLLSLRGTAFLHTGDLSGSYESYAAFPADLLKVAHHGSLSSTGAQFLSVVSPQAALLSCAKESRAEECRERFGAIPVFDTARSGAVTVVFAEDGFTVKPFLPRDASSDTGDEDHGRQ